MTVRGRVRDGAIVVEGNIELPEGTIVDVDVRPVQAPSLFDRMKHLSGVVEGLPADLAQNHDHYLHGTSKGNDD